MTLQRLFRDFTCIFVHPAILFEKYFIFSENFFAQFFISHHKILYKICCLPLFFPFVCIYFNSPRGPCPVRACSKFKGRRTYAAFEIREQRPFRAAFAAGPEPGRLRSAGYRRAIRQSHGGGSAQFPGRHGHRSGRHCRAQDPQGHTSLVPGLYPPQGPAGGQRLSSFPALRQQPGGHIPGKSGSGASESSAGSGAGGALFFPGGSHRHQFFLRSGGLLRPGPGRPLPLHIHRRDRPQRYGPSPMAPEPGQREKPGAVQCLPPCQ